MAQRPVGISVLSILSALAGVLLFIGAAVFAALSTAESFLESLIEMSGASYIPNIGELIAAIALAVAAILAILGILNFVAAYGLWAGKGWAWYLSVILTIFGLILSLLSLRGNPVGGILGIIATGVILWYFFRPYVRAFFGQGPATQPPPPPPP